MGYNIFQEHVVVISKTKWCMQPDPLEIRITPFYWIIKMIQVHIMVTGCNTFRKKWLYSQSLHTPTVSLYFNCHCDWRMVLWFLARVKLNLIPLLTQFVKSVPVKTLCLSEDVMTEPLIRACFSRWRDRRTGTEPNHATMSCAHFICKR